MGFLGGFFGVFGVVLGVYFWVGFLLPTLPGPRRARPGRWGADGRVRAGNRWMPAVLCNHRKKLKGWFLIFFSLLFSTLFYLPARRIHCVGGRWDRNQDGCVCLRHWLSHKNLQWCETNESRRCSVIKEKKTCNDVLLKSYGIVRKWVLRIRIRIH